MLSDALINGLFNTVISGAVLIVLAKINVGAKRQRTRIEQTGEKTHGLVNSAMTNLLKLYAVAMRRVADLSGHADDKTLAKLAEDAWRKNVDSQPKEQRTSGNVFTTQNHHGRQKE